MRHLRLIVIALAVILAAQLVLHNHTLIPAGAASTCSVCAFGADRTIAPPVVVAPLVLAYALPAVVPPTTCSTLPRTITLRGPPRA